MVPSTGSESDGSDLGRREDVSGGLLDAIPDAVIALDGEGIVRRWNSAATKLYGWAASDRLGLPLEIPGRNDLGPALAAHLHALRNGVEVDEEIEDRRPDGAPLWVRVRVRPVRDDSGAPSGVLGISRDTTDLELAAQTLIGQNRVLEDVARGRPLREILDAVAVIVESRIPGSSCSVLLADLAGRVLRVGAGPTLPPEYNAAVDGVPIGPNAGSCGTAAFRREVVVTPDLATDPLWNDYRHLALPHGLRSCVSVPIFAGSNPAPDGTRRLLGTFALYRREPGQPGPAALELLMGLGGLAPLTSGTVAEPPEARPRTLLSPILAGAAHLAGLAIEREHTLRHLQDSEERFRVLLDGVRDYAVFSIDPSGTILTWNVGAERTFGRCAVTAVGVAFDSFCTPEDRAAGWLAFGLSISQQTGSWEDDRWWVRQSGERFFASLVVTPLLHDDRRPRGFAVVVRDLTERHRLEQQLQETRKMDAIGRLAGGIAHDFNNLLTVINGYSDLLIDDLDPADVRLDSIQAIRDAGQRAARLTAQLLTFSRRSLIEPRLLDLNAVAAATVAMLRRLIGENIALVTRLSGDIGRVRIDPGQLDQVIMNLAVNARDAMPHGGALTLSTDAIDCSDDLCVGNLPVVPGRYVRLTVKDTGFGIPRDLHSRVFEPFFTSKAVGHGTGLGLATVFSIVRQAGGFVTLESAPGEGSSFSVHFPRIDVGEEIHAPSVPGRLRGDETILVVEDERAVANLAFEALSSHGYRVLLASGGQAAIRMARSHPGPIPLVVTDVVMPDLGGAPLAAALREVRPNIAVLFTSGYTDDALLRAGVEAARDAFLPKPYTPSGLCRRVREVLDAQGGTAPGPLTAEAT